MKTLTLIFILYFQPAWAFSQDKPSHIRMEAIEAFPVLTREGTASNRKPYGPFHAEEDLNALAGDDLNFTFHMAAAEGIFPGKNGKYTIRLNTLTERDGECVYHVYVNDEPVGLFRQNPPTNEFTAPASLVWPDVHVPAEARIRVESNNWSNLKRHEENFFEYARGRWTSVDFIPVEDNDHLLPPGSGTGVFEKLEKTGYAGVQVNADYNETEQAYYLALSGVNSEDQSNDAGFFWRNVNRDFELETLVYLIDLAGNEGLEAGIRVSISAAPDAPFFDCIIQQNGVACLRYRSVSNTAIREFTFNTTGAEMIQLKKNGNTFTMSAAPFGEEYERKSVDMTGFDGSLRTGFFIGSRKGSGAARFSHVRYYGD
jgi:hypothetical protein